jgi:predicted small lipoprotein YifL
MQRATNTLVLVLIVSFTMNACGTKGPLYIPEQRYPQDTSAKN